MKEWRVSMPRKLRNTSYCRREGSNKVEEEEEEYGEAMKVAISSNRRKSRGLRMQRGRDFLLLDEVKPAR